MKLIKRKKYIVDNDVDKWSILEEYDNGITLRYEESHWDIDIFVDRTRHKKKITEKEQKEIDKIAESKGFRKCRGLFGAFYRINKLENTSRTIDEIKRLVSENKVEFVNAKIKHLDNYNYDYFLNGDTIKEDRDFCTTVLNSLKEADIAFTNNNAEIASMYIKNTQKWNEVANKHYRTMRYGVNDNIWYIELFICFPDYLEKENIIQRTYEEKEKNNALDEADLRGILEEPKHYTYEDIMFGR